MPSRMSKHGRTRPTHSSHSYGWNPDVPDLSRLSDWNLLDEFWTIRRGENL
jgi:hypothetical protein